MSADADCSAPVADAVHRDIWIASPILDLSAKLGFLYTFHKRRVPATGGRISELDALLYSDRARGPGG